jgi:hypothetical protein
MRSEFKRLNRNVLLEWVYDTSNYILEPFKVVKNSRDLITSYAAADSTITNNGLNNQLVIIDEPLNKFGKLDTSKYNFLSVLNYVPSSPVLHDRIKIYFPANYTFEEYQGIQIRLYTYDYRNKKFYDISNFYYDRNETDKNLLQTYVSPLLYQDITWNKYIELNVPSVYFLGLQRENGYAKEGTINYYLTGGDGLSQTAPIFIDFRFITKVTTIGTTTTYLTTQKVTLQVPQIPKLDALGIYMKESKDGDYFEIYATYDNSFETFAIFMDDSKKINKFYYLEFDITVFEENIKGKTQTYKIENDFTEIIEYRPIIKYSTTNAIIDVEMRLINKDDGNVVVRKAAYGMKPDQLSKYLINSKKINIGGSRTGKSKNVLGNSISVQGVTKPKIYSKNQFDKYRIDQLGKSPVPENTLDVPVPELIPIADFSKVISAYSPQALNVTVPRKIDNYHPIGVLKIGIRPFDNIYKFFLAFKILKKDQLEPLDLTNCEQLKLVFKSDNNLIEFPQYITEETVARFGMCQFRVTENKFNDLKSLYKDGNITYYITTTNQGFQCVIYSGLFTILDTATSLGGGSLSDLISGANIEDLIGSGNISEEVGDFAETPETIIEPPVEQEVAIVVRKKVPITSKDLVSNFNKKGKSNGTNVPPKGLDKFQKKKK